MAAKEKFLITEIVPHFFVWELKKMGFDVDEYAEISKEDCLKIIDRYSGLYIRGRLKAGKDLLEKAVCLQYIVRPGSGLDIIDMEIAQAKNIHVFNSPEGNRDSLGEFTVGALISLLRKIPQANDQIKKGIFDRNVNTGTDLMSKTVGIIGFGNMGSAFAKRLSAFGVRILAYDKFKKNFAPTGVEEVSLQVLMNESDIISFHIPYNTENHYFFNETFLQAVKKPFYLINTSRGKVANTRVIVNGLQLGKIRGAILDVFENEDFNNLTPEQKDLLDYLANSGNVVMTPHIAGKTHESEMRIHQILIEKIKQVKSDKKD
ncbi:MAG TPA: NAD(P)-dependent oxidoreductase [Bacteroidia bacterium]|nr:phosphoglycerate dehydrogenase [Sphingobacteriales bacterium]HPD64743.1 NAD(P)-dependent oxidoreductase [Bacteroidia bacterium]HRS59323.1 NAD(P)-dependent oxidoreductase [Bacteroidia bacterium]HRU69153.1 NAD(P)-dependent oxidoreductase [Bacteroidia bacterium]